MKALMIVTTMTLLTAAPLCAQERAQDPRGYAAALGGFASSLGTFGNTTGDVRFEGGVRVGPHVMVIANVGRFADLQPDLQPMLAATTAALAANQGVFVTGAGSLPAWYGTGGVRAEIPAGSRVFPYALATVGIARLNPSPAFIYTSGPLPDGSTPAGGTDVTAILTSAGVVTPSASSTAPMFTVGGGVQIPVSSRVAVDLGYRYSRINADTALSALPLNANGLTFGIGYRF